jgi:putative transposase
MAGAFSIDLRKRVVDAVVRDGMSRRGAAARFGVGVSTAIDWVAQFHATGSLAPGQMGGHRPKKLTGAWREWLLERCRTDFTLRGLVAELAERGMQVDYKTVWAFVHAEKLTHKKRR